MGVVKRKSSPFWWMNLERPGQRVLRASTKVPFAGATPRQTAENRRLAQEIYNTKMADLARLRLAPTPVELPEPRRRLETWTYVYFVTDGDAIKIGRARNVLARMQLFATANQKPLRLLATVLGHERLEYQIHRHFKAARRHKEWFAPTPELLAFIESVKAGVHPMNLIFANVVSTPNTARGAKYQAEQELRD